jgi:phosphate transport system permease protein
MSTATIPRPSKPWGVNFKQTLPDLGVAVATVLITFAIVAYTPMKGKLAFVAVLFLVALAASAAVSGIRRDRKAALNSISTVMVYVAGMFVIFPLGSILYEIISAVLVGFPLEFSQQIWLSPHLMLHLMKVACFTPLSELYTLL